MSLRRWLTGFFAFAISSGVSGGQDVTELGAQVFARCQSCHQIGKDAVNGVGPQLNGLFSRRIGSAPDFAYSAVLASAGKQGESWDKATLSLFLAGKSKQFASTRMAAVAAITNRNDREALINMLSNVDASGKGAPKLRRDPDLPEAIAAIEGDPEYGEYLAGECSTCHQADGSNQGIPSITGWPVPDFAKTLNAYRVGARENPVMQNIAKALGDEEIAALAAYFSKQ